jgi:hypothetical protein
LGRAKAFKTLEEWPIKQDVAGKTLYIFKEFNGNKTVLGPWSDKCARVASWAGAINEGFTDEDAFPVADLACGHNPQDIGF